jgi:protein-arginine kinase activator protein McsA
MKDNTDEFDLRLDISDMMWEVDRLKDIEQAYVDEEEYEKAAIILERQKRLIRLISNKEKKLKQYDDTL